MAVVYYMYYYDKWINVSTITIIVVVARLSSLAMPFFTKVSCILCKLNYLYALCLCNLCIYVSVLNRFFNLDFVCVYLQVSSVHKPCCRGKNWTVEEFGWQVKGSTKSAASLHSKQTHRETSRQNDRQADSYAMILTEEEDRRVSRSAGKQTGEGSSQQARQAKQTRRDMDEYAIWQGVRQILRQGQKRGQTYSCWD